MPEPVVSANDRPIPPESNEEALRAAAEAARRLYQAAQEQLKNGGTAPAQATPARPMSLPAAVTPEQRLDVVHRLSKQMLNSFDTIDATGDRFIDRQELRNMAQGQVPILRDASSLLASDTSTIQRLNIMGLHNDNYRSSGGGRLGGSGRTIRFDQFGITRNDLGVLQAISSNDLFDLRAEAGSQALRGFGGAALIVGGVGAVMSPIFFDISKRAGLVGLGLSLGFAAAGYGLSYLYERNRLTAFRTSLSNDASLDALTFRHR